MLLFLFSLARYGEVNDEKQDKDNTVRQVISRIIQRYSEVWIIIRKVTD